MAANGLHLFHRHADSGSGYVGRVLARQFRPLRPPEIIDSAMLRPTSGRRPDSFDVLSGNGAQVAYARGAWAHSEPGPRAYRRVRQLRRVRANARTSWVSYLIEELVRAMRLGLHVTVHLQCHQAVQMPPDAQRERHGSGRQLRAGRAHLVEKPRVEIGPVKLAVLIEVFGVGPGGRCKRRELSADPACRVWRTARPENATLSVKWRGRACRPEERGPRSAVFSAFSEADR